MPATNPVRGPFLPPSCAPACPPVKIYPHHCRVYTPPLPGTCTLPGARGVRHHLKEYAGTYVCVDLLRRESSTRGQAGWVPVPTRWVGPEEGWFRRTVRGGQRDGISHWRGVLRKVTSCWGMQAPLSSFWWPGFHPKTGVPHCGGLGTATPFLGGNRVCTECTVCMSSTLLHYSVVTRWWMSHVKRVQPVENCHRDKMI